MSDDPRARLKLILSGVTSTKDDDVTAADLLVIYEGGPETYRRLFETLDYDAVMAVGRHSERESGDGRRRQDVPIRYDARIPLSVSAIDKDDVTATKLLNKIRVNIQSELEASAQTTNYTWILERDESSNRRMGGYDPLWMDTYTVHQRPMTGT